MHLSARPYEHEQIPTSVCALLVLGVSLLCAPRVLASTLYVGPVYLSGAGSFYDPVLAVAEGLEGSVGMTLSATGSNGVDSVSISVSEVDQGGYIGFPVVGSTMAFSAGIGQCMDGFSSLWPSVQCTATIDGITGIGSFTNLGGGAGIVQVYQEVVNPPYLFPQPGPLLAQAEVMSYATITSVTPVFAGSQEFQSTFELGSGTPEPSTGIMGLIGVVALVCLLLRKKHTSKRATSKIAH